MLDRARLLDLLHELGQELDQRGVRGELFIVGGAAMALAFDTRRATRDIDGVFEPTQTIYDAARVVAARHDDIPDDWLNDAAKGFLPGDDPNATVLLDIPGLRVRVASPRYLLAMKLLASRVDRDTDDIRELLSRTGIRSATEALDLLEHTYPGHTLPPHAWYLIEEILTHGTSALDTAMPNGARARVGACDAWMPRAQRRCALPRGHRGGHRSRR